jgi:hypothetical protein
MSKRTRKGRLALLALGAIPLLAMVSCAPFGGGFGFYDDHYYDYGWGYDEVIIVDDYGGCFSFFDCF